MKQSKAFRYWRSLVALALVLGCGSSAVPRELVHARQAYAEARQGPAGELAPIQLDSARQALENAEAVFRSDGDEPSTLDLSYIALRRVELAVLHGEYERGNRERARAVTEYTELSKQELPSPTPPVSPPAPPQPVVDAAALIELARRIRVVHPGGYFSIEALQDFFAKQLSKETLEHLANSTDAIWVDSNDAALKNGRLYCFASLGLTERPPEKRNSRRPVARYSGIQLINPGEDQSDEGIRLCRVWALKSAAAAMSGESLEQQRTDSDMTRHQGKPVTGEKPSPTTVRLYSNGISDDVRQEVFNAIPDDFRRAFDYRKLEWVVSALQFRLGGRIICHGQVGVSAPAPTGRSPRSPGHVWFGTWEMTPEESRERNAEDRCASDVLTRSVAAALESSWDKDGLLQDFELTREDGVPLVRPAKRPKPAVAPTRRAPAPPPAPASSPVMLAKKCQPPGGKVLRYTDHCFNGDCTRTFENGCSIRFQAPYCYDILTSRWTWKPDGC